MTPELEAEPVHSLVFTPAFSVTFRHAIFQHDLAYVKNVSSTDFFTAEVDFWPPKVYFFDLIISQEVSRRSFCER